MPLLLVLIAASALGLEASSTNYRVKRQGIKPAALNALSPIFRNANPMPFPTNELSAGQRQAISNYIANQRNPLPGIPLESSLKLQEILTNPAVQNLLSNLTPQQRLNLIQQVLQGGGAESALSSILGAAGSGGAGLGGIANALGGAGGSDLGSAVAGLGGSAAGLQGILSGGNEESLLQKQFGIQGSQRPTTGGLQNPNSGCVALSPEQASALRSGDFTSLTDTQKKQLQSCLGGRRTRRETGRVSDNRFRRQTVESGGIGLGLGGLLGGRRGPAVENPFSAAFGGSSGGASGSGSGFSNLFGSQASKAVPGIPLSQLGHAPTGSLQTGPDGETRLSSEQAQALKTLVGKGQINVVPDTPKEPPSLDCLSQIKDTGSYLVDSCGNRLPSSLFSVTEAKKPASSTSDLFKNPETSKVVADRVGAVVQKGNSAPKHVRPKGR